MLSASCKTIYLSVLVASPYDVVLYKQQKRQVWSVLSCLFVAQTSSLFSNQNIML